MSKHNKNTIPVRIISELSEDVAQDMESLDAYSNLVDNLACQRDQFQQMLKAYLLASRARATAGYKPGRCRSCDHPHLNQLCKSKCVHHEAVALLKSQGVDVEGMY